MMAMRTTGAVYVETDDRRILTGKILREPFQVGICDAHSLQQIVIVRCRCHCVPIHTTMKASFADCGLPVRWTTALPRLKATRVVGCIPCVLFAWSTDPSWPVMGWFLSAAVGLSFDDEVVAGGHQLGR